MSCTDDKTACPCEPGLEVNDLRRFEAADLKAAILGIPSEDEDGDYEDDGDDTWYKLEQGVPVPNENYDPAVRVEVDRMYGVIWDKGGFNRDKEAYTAYRAFYEANSHKISDTKYVPWTFKWNGKELPVEVVENNGGSEGGGEAAHMVYKVCDRLFRLDGSYYSYDGTTWNDDSFREVKAVTKAVVFYE